MTSAKNIAMVFRHAVTDGVRQVDGGGASVDGGFDNPAEEVTTRQASRPLPKTHIIYVRLRARPMFSTIAARGTVSRASSAAWRERWRAEVARNV